MVKIARLVARQKLVVKDGCFKGEAKNDVPVYRQVRAPVEALQWVSNLQHPALRLSRLLSICYLINSIHV